MNSLELTTRSVSEVTEDAVNLKRVIYILQYGDLQQNAHFLVNYIHKVTSLPHNQFECVHKINTSLPVTGMFA